MICKDVVIVEKDERGEKVFICIECKYSLDGSITKLYHPEVAHKAELACNAFMAGGLDLKQCILVFTPFRPHDLPLTFTAACTTLVLTLETLQNLYSPSLSARPQFIRSLNIPVAHPKRKREEEPIGPKKASH
jgi:hypothetical protein